MIETVICAFCALTKRWCFSMWPAQGRLLAHTNFVSNDVTTTITLDAFNWIGNVCMPMSSWKLRMASSDSCEVIVVEVKRNARYTAGRVLDYNHALFRLRVFMGRIRSHKKHILLWWIGNVFHNFAKFASDSWVSSSCGTCHDVSCCIRQILWLKHTGLCRKRAPAFIMSVANVCSREMTTQWANMLKFYARVCYEVFVSFRPHRRPAWKWTAISSTKTADVDGCVA